MATLLIREYSHLGRDDLGRQSNFLSEPALASDTYTLTGASAVVDETLDSLTRFVLLIADANARVEFGPKGSTPVADGDSMLLLATAGQVATTQIFAVEQDTVISAKTA